MANQAECESYFQANVLIFTFIACDIQPINRPWTEDILIFQSGPPVAHEIIGNV